MQWTLISSRPSMGIGPIPSQYQQCSKGGSGVWIGQTLSQAGRAEHQTLWGQWAEELYACIWWCGEGGWSVLFPLKTNQTLVNQVPKSQNHIELCAKQECPWVISWMISLEIVPETLPLKKGQGPWLKAFVNRTLLLNTRLAGGFYSSKGWLSSIGFIKLAWQMLVTFYVVSMKQWNMCFEMSICQGVLKIGHGFRLNITS